MSLNINSEAWCKKAYLDYYCHGNTMGLTANDIGQIKGAWPDKLQSWQNTVSKDVNLYQFNDEEIQESKNAGINKGKEVTGVSGDTHAGTKIAGAAISAGGAAWNAATGGLTAVKNVYKNPKSIVGKESFAKPGKGEGTFQKTGTGEKKSFSAHYQAAIAIATALLYRITKPNKENAQACEEMQQELIGAQATVHDAEAEMEAMGEKLITLSDEAMAYNEEANENIVDQKTEYDIYAKAAEVIKAKAESGEALTDGEKALYNDSIAGMTETRAAMNETTEDTGDVVGDIYGDMETFQKGYDYAAETLGEVQGMTEFTASFDSATRDLAKMEAVSQGLNAANGLMAGAKLMASGIWNWALGIASIAAGISSGVAIVEQMQYAGKAGATVGTRKETEKINAHADDFYANEIDNYAAWMDGVSAMELKIPDDMDAPEDTGLPDNGEDKPVPGTPDALKPQPATTEKKEKEEF